MSWHHNTAHLQGPGRVWLWVWQSPGCGGCWHRAGCLRGVVEGDPALAPDTGPLHIVWVAHGQDVTVHCSCAHCLLTRPHWLLTTCPIARPGKPGLPVRFLLCLTVSTGHWTDWLSPGYRQPSPGHRGLVWWVIGGSLILPAHFLYARQYQLSSNVRCDGILSSKTHIELYTFNRS